MNPVEEVALPSKAAFDEQVRQAYRPVVIRGMARDWPLVRLGRTDPAEALRYCASFDSGAAADIMLAPPTEGGRFFYRNDMTGFNFERRKGTLGQLAGELARLDGQDDAPGMYAGAADLHDHLPGFASDHPLPLAEEQDGSQARIWMGNATQVATHFDLSDNFAVVAVGARQFRLFPPDVTKHLYIGPLDVTPAGQPVSMVNPLEPDLKRYPDYEKAEAQALYAELEPGDAIYVPTLWWHHVAATSPINILVNYWHNNSERGGPFLALIHALMSVRDLPAGQREGWRAWFDHFIFGEGAGSAADHLPAHINRITGPPSEERSETMRRFIVQVLSAR
ncbi:cupin-like domain-containing protein [Qipengyuania atrilutea]|uniref:Cupin-like domain-containing protein n=1 Tax=Qipengyuania atrilutea TaxID=2744473 RepID=A0A850GYW7_9SPHN|nr:cupin-like domain-containing protein [Actirhodobacter atriluteus]NVD44801.1 cupin-like domain-containing protein [Actirhodobacter atriluteus]